MTDQSDILLGTTPAAAVDTAPVVQATPMTTPSVDNYLEQLATIRNEDGLQKYASIKDALTGTAHAQEFIKTLKEEKAALELEREVLVDELANRMSVEEAMSQIASPAPQGQTVHNGVGREDVHSIIKDYEQSKVRESNRKSVIDTLVNHCAGSSEKAAEMITNRLSEMGLTRDQLSALAETSPKAVYELFKINGKGPSSMSQALGGTINTDAFAVSTSHREVIKPKPLPIGATRQQVVEQWRQAIADVN